LTLLDFESGDYRAFLGPWYDFFLERGRWRGLGEMTERISSYPPLYLYLLSISTLLPVPKLYAIKLWSILSDYVAAWFVWRLSRRISPAKRGGCTWVIVFLFLPTVVMNGALWGQCDVMYTSGLLGSLYYLLERRPFASMVAFGFSCALKPQAVFWLPLLAGLLVSSRLPWKWIWVAPGVYAGCGVPQMLAGRPAWHVLLHWARVSNTPGRMTFGATNWYQWVFERHPEVFEGAGIVLTIVATAFLVLWMADGPPSAAEEDRWLVTWALVSVLFPPFLLPGMHERYFFAAEALSVVYAMHVAGGWRVAAAVQFASAFSYLPYLFGEEPIPRWLLALVMLGALALVVRRLLQLEGRPMRRVGTE
jgi:Gpi18-like mannosyltransferase